MPGWHEATKQLQQDGKLRLIGIIQEQHPDRCRLFMQWKQMDWPILVDSLNLLGTSAVPITLAIDEHGIIRGKGLRLDAAGELEETFLATTFEAPPESSDPKPQQPSVPDLERLKADARDRAPAWRAYGDALVMWADAARLDEAIDAYQRASELDPKDGPTHFRLGVAFRKRYDSSQRQLEDFPNAVRHWKAALDLNPNQYIWRRRIQQYGPRLDKPYPFYDWIPAAREEIQARGEEPAPLIVEPGGAEFAHPSQAFEITDSRREEPDPSGRIFRDEKDFVIAETTVVPPVVEPGEAARIHVVLRPNESIKAHWNNEVDPLEYWIDAPEGWQVDQRFLTVPNPAQVVSQEIRKLEFEVRSGEGASPGETQFSSYALYYVCEDVSGTCLYRRQDINIPIRVRPDSF